MDRPLARLSPPVAVELDVVGEVGGYEVGASPVDYAVEVAVVYCGNALVEIVVEVAPGI